MKLTFQGLSMVLQVNKKWLEADQVCCFELADPFGRQLPSFVPGSHIDVQVNNNLTRQYSLCNDPAESSSTYRIAVLLEENSRGGSKQLHAELNEKDLVLVSKPRNSFKLEQGAKNSILFAGGIGITPILSMAKWLSRHNHALTLHYCAKTEKKAAFLEEIRQSAFGDVSNFYFSDGEHSQRFRNQLWDIVADSPRESHVYVCGPTGFINAVLQAFREKGWSEHLLHREFFKAESSESMSDGAFEVELASSGQVFLIPESQTILEVLEQAGVEIPSSCEQGICGTCVTRIVSGEPDHRDLFLEDEEHAANELFTPCCSRAKSKRLVLDL